MKSAAEKSPYGLLCIFRILQQSWYVAFIALPELNEKDLFSPSTGL
jgi:hypothetical protein